MNNPRYVVVKEFGHRDSAVKVVDTHSLGPRHKVVGTFHVYEYAAVLRDLLNRNEEPEP